MDEADNASPSFHAVAIAAIDHLIEPGHRSLRRTGSMPLHHRHRQTFDFDLGVEHYPVLRAGAAASPPAGRIKPYATESFYVTIRYSYRIRIQYK
jgi:hypothetical protein